MTVTATLTFADSSRRVDVEYLCLHRHVDEGDARALAEWLLATVRPQRWMHSQAVAAEADRLCERVGIDPTVVVAAAWLHDIGYSPRVVQSGFHPLDGARYLRAHQCQDAVCRLVAHHTDAKHQVTVELADQLCLEFASLDGLERDVLWTADATCGPRGERLTLDERIAEVDNRYGRSHPVTVRLAASRVELAAAIDRVAVACR